MIRGRAPLTAALAVGGAIAFVCPPPAGAAGGAVVGSVAGSGAAALSHWTRARREGVAPLSLLTLPGAASGGVAAATSRSATTTDPLLAGASAVGGVDTGESTLFPNRANGKLYGIYEIRRGRGTEREEYECSGSVIDAAAGDVVLTAGHCVIDPETGTVAREVVFVPGYREGAAPFGQWAATSYATTEAWARTVGSPDPDEAGDMAMLVLADDSEGQGVEAVVGALRIAFDQAREQTYTQYGYPAAEPYDGEVLYSNAAAYAGSDPNFSPAPIKIASDFTAGSSGGPWTIGPSDAPTVVSLTDYSYEKEPGYLYGAYLGEAARTVYEAVAAAAPATEGEVSGEEPTEGGASTGGSTAARPATAASSTANGSTAPRLTAVRHRKNGTVVVSVKVGSAGTLRLTGVAVHADSLTVPAAGAYRMTVVARGGARRRLRRRGAATVEIRIAFTAAGTTRRLTRRLRLRARRARPGSSAGLSKRDPPQHRPRGRPLHDPLGERPVPAPRRRTAGLSGAHQVALTPDTAPGPSKGADRLAAGGPVATATSRARAALRRHLPLGDQRLRAGRQTLAAPRRRA